MEILSFIFQGKSLRGLWLSWLVTLFPFLLWFWVHIGLLSFRWNAWETLPIGIAYSLIIGLIFSLILFGALGLPSLYWLYKTGKTRFIDYIRIPALWVAFVSTLLGIVAATFFENRLRESFLEISLSTFIVAFVPLITPILTASTTYWFFRHKDRASKAATVTTYLFFAIWNIYCFFIGLYWLALGMVRESTLTSFMAEIIKDVI